MKVIYRLAKNIATNFDQAFGTSSKQRGGDIYRYLIKKWSFIRRTFDPLKIRFCSKLGLLDYRNLRLHLGCGSKHFEGYINVDLWLTDATDVICDITRLPWPTNSVAIIESYHVLEHISHRKIEQTLREWCRVLKPHGKLILECPDFDKAIMEYQAGSNGRLINIFGQQRFHGDAHLFGYNPSRLVQLLKENGFDSIKQELPQSSQSLKEPSFRIECEKSGTPAANA